MKPHKLLILKLGSLGDILHSLPAQQQLRRERPEIEVHWVAEPHYRPLLDTVPGIHRIWVADTRKWRRNPRSLKGLKDLILGLRREKFQMAVDFQGLLKSALLARASGARQIIGFAREPVREKVAPWFYHRPVYIRQVRQHRIESNFDLVREIGCQGPVRARIPMDFPEEAETYVQGQLAKLGISRPILLNPGAGWPTKIWPITYFVQLACLIQEKLDVPTLFTYGPGEEHLIEEARALMGDRLKTFPTDIVQLGVLSSLSRMMVAGDTGPLHLAVATGTPTVAVMGPTFPWRNGPFSASDPVVTCERPCPNPYKKSCTDHFCMNIPVEPVFQAVSRGLQESEPS